jgi:CubicO group peptidase (beta-lactamase class C family)
MKFLFGFLLLYAVSAAATPVDTTEGLRKLMDTLYSRGQFNGSILVAVNGRAIFRNGYGESNVGTHEKFSPATISCLASVSKQFTAMAIMMLAEQHKIKYDDPVAQYIREWPAYARGITIKHLLTHTSGIPEVGDLGIDHPGLTNAEVIKTLVNKNDLVFKPGVRYQYSNTGYILLAIIVERITGRSFKDFLTREILIPLKMDHTFLMDAATERPGHLAIGYNGFGKVDDEISLTTGDGGMYSTVDDLLKWDAALYSGKLVKPATLDTAFTPATVQEGKTTYGFGWNITGNKDDLVVWHTGNTAGYRAFIERRLRDRVAIIMLTNKGNSRRMEISEAVVNILRGLPYRLPRIPISGELYQEIEVKGISAALHTFDSLKASNDTLYDFAESELNTLGYELIGENKKPEALQIFRLNTLCYPSSSNAFDGLGDAYLEVHQKDSAINCYQKAVGLDGNNLQSRDKLAKLKKGSNWKILMIGLAMMAICILLLVKGIRAKVNL